jgi:hypothetical protein
MVDEDPAHDLRCDSEEMCSALPVNHPLVGQLQIGFMNQGRGLQGVVLALASSLPFANCPKQSRDIFTGQLIHAISSLRLNRVTIVADFQD